MKHWARTTCLERMSTTGRRQGTEKKAELISAVLSRAQKEEKQRVSELTFWRQA